MMALAHDVSPLFESLVRAAAAYQRPMRRISEYGVEFQRHRQVAFNWIYARLLAAHSRQALADARGKIGSVVGGLCFFADAAACSKICQRQARVDLAAFVEEFIKVAVGE